METKKTLAYLNSKIWYRGLKVFFVGIFIFFLIALNLSIFNEGIKEINLNKTIVTCNWGSEDKFSLTDAGIYLNTTDLENFNYKDFIQSGDIFSVEKILRKCLPYSYMNGKDLNESDVYELQRGADNKLDNPQFSSLDLVSKLISDEQSDPGNNLIEYKAHLFDIVPVYSYKEFLLNFTIANLLVLLGFEVIRRVFYYIILGTFIPKK